MGLFWIVLFMLAVPIGLPVVDAILLAILLAAAPSVAMAQVPLIGEAPVERMPAYWGSIVTLWVLGTASWLVGTRMEGPAAVGLVAMSPVALVSWSVGLTAGGLAAIVLFRQVGIWAGEGNQDVLGQLLPRTPRERSVFAILSLAAGGGEEMAYRGYAIPVLTPLIGVTGAALLTTVVFGLLHAYQGPLGVVRTGVLGGVLAWGFLASGSLWPAIIAHTLIDLLTGLVFGERLLRTGER